MSPMSSLLSPLSSEPIPETHLIRDLGRAQPPPVTLGRRASVIQTQVFPSSAAADTRTSEPGFPALRSRLRLAAG